MMILTGCAGGSLSSLKQILAGERIGAAAAPIALDSLPDECRREWGLLSRGEIVGTEAQIIVDRYEHYITDEINPQKRRCWNFHERQKAGLASGK